MVPGHFTCMEPQDSTENEKKGKKEVRRLNVGIIGCGGIAQNHVFSMSLLENNARKIWKWKEAPFKFKPKLYALADIDPKQVENLSTHFPVKKIYKGSTAGYDLIADPEVHAIFVLVPTSDHLDYVLKAAEAGKHVFCEKPLAFTPEDVDKMIAAREEYGVVIQAGLVMRSAPQINYLKQFFEEKREKWGQLTNIIFRDTQEKPYKGAEEVHNSTWRKDKDKAHAGILFEHTIHDMDGMIFTLGEIESVYAKIKFVAGIEDIEDSVAAIISFKNGVSLTINSMWNDIDYSQRRYEFFFENAYLTIIVDERDKKAVDIRYKYLKEEEKILDDGGMDQMFREGIGMPHINAEVPGPYYYEDLRFLDAIAREKPAEVTLEFGRYVQKVIEACYTSSKEGRVIHL
ncbi:Inositol 2-dehydrogenase/D-chiro-inositol 3-dehydrogenase [subsurface metagenome]